MSGIGTLQESSLHAALKTWYAKPGDQFELRVDGAIIDIVRGKQLIEIQTRNFMGIKHKLARLTEHHRVRLVYPIAREKWIVKLDDALQTQISRRRSPKKGRVEQVFMEMVNIADLVAQKNFTLEVVFIREEEVWSMARRNHRRPSWRRGGWTRHDRRLIDVTDRLVFKSPADYRALLPASLGETFTNHELAAALHVPAYHARRITYCLRHMGVLESSSKRGREMLYVVTTDSRWKK
ncbi:MAG TPA: hypothetical protein VGK81_00365 [Anaerolineae bacterium]